MSLAPTFRLSLLGKPCVVNAQGQKIVIESPLMLALLALLMLNPQKTFLRSELYTLFYPENDKKQAEQNFRQIIHRLRKLLSDSDENSLFLRETMTIALDPKQKVWVDVLEFNERVQRVMGHQHRRIAVCRACISDLEFASRLYRDEFMSGTPLAGAVEEWAFAQRTSLIRKAIYVLGSLATYYLEEGNWLKGQEYIDQWFATDALDEDAMMLQMRLSYVQGKRMQALQMYQSFSQLLHRRLGVKPSASLQELFTTLQSDSLSVQAFFATRQEPQFHSKSPIYVSHNPLAFSDVPIPFIGRRAETQIVLERLADRSTRLMTLNGMGGIGKTALALHVAELDAQNWRDGVVVVSAVQGQSLLARLVETFSIASQDKPSKASALYDHLRDKEMLLVLDQLDQMEDYKYTLKTLLFYAPHIKVIGTSRQRLELGTGLNIHLGGLSYPSEASGIAEPSDAVKLFEASVRTFYPQMDFSHHQIMDITRICQWVQGLPLAILLASTWVSELSCSEILAQIQSNPDFLRDRRAIFPVQQASMQRVFERSWVELSPLEHQSLKQLAHMEGAFTLMDAQAHCGISADLVAVLADKSLLEALQSASFQLHTLFKSFIQSRAD